MSATPIVVDADVDFGRIVMHRAVTHLISTLAMIARSGDGAPNQGHRSPEQPRQGQHSQENAIHHVKYTMATGRRR